jgi:peptide/nickel transport system substrate-binding protein
MRQMRQPYLHTEDGWSGPVSTRRRFLAKTAGAVLAVGLSPHLLAACSQEKQASKGSNELIFALSSYPPSLNPFLNVGTAAATYSLAAYRGLVGYGPSGDISPELAKSWEMQGDTTYVFELRENAKFHNGQQVTPEDVQYSFELIRREKSFDLSSFFENVVDIRPDGTRAIKLSLRQPDASFLDNLALPQAPVISKEAAQSNPDNWVGAGPFEVTSEERGRHILLSEFESYYKQGLPKLQKLQMTAYEDGTQRVNALIAGDVDLIEYVPWEAMSRIENDSNLVLITTLGPFMYLTFNVQYSPFEDPRVRRALGYAINRGDILKAAFSGRGELLTGMPVPESSQYYNASVQRFWEYDPTKAEQLMADAGYQDGFKAQLLSTSQYGMHQSTAEIVQQNLEDVGVNVELSLPEWATRVSRGNEGDYQFSVMGSSTNYNDPDALSDFLSGGASYVRSYGFEDSTIDSLLDAGRTTLNESERKQIYNRLYRRAMELSPILPLTWRSEGYAFQRYVKGFQQLPEALTFWSGYTLEQTSVT